MIYKIDDLKIKFSNFAKFYNKVRQVAQPDRLSISCMTKFIYCKKVLNIVLKYIDF